MLNLALANYLTLLKNWIDREEGQDLIEYGLLLFLISIVAIVSIQAAGLSIKAFWDTIAATLAGL
jgi:pilus assembly protein Flp/PilA